MSKTQKLICHPQLGQMSGESVLKCSFSVNLAGGGGGNSTGGKGKTRDRIKPLFCEHSLDPNVYAAKRFVCCVAGKNKHNIRYTILSHVNKGVNLK